VNWLALSVVALQAGAGIWYAAHGKGLHGLLWVMYAATNVVLMRMAAAR